MKIHSNIFFVILLVCCSALGQIKRNTLFSIVDFGAKADGKTVNTVAIQAAVDKASKVKGGAIVLVPKGDFVTGSIVLKSNVAIQIEEGAVLLGSTNPKDYQKISFEGRPDAPKKDDNSQLGLFVAHKVNNIKFFGKGKIDGQGLALALHIDSLHHAGVVEDPQYNTQRNRPNETMRPKLFRFSQCSTIDIQDLNLGSAAAWGLSFELCDKVFLNNLNILNRAYWNNDGIDITDCKNVTISNCTIDSADDGICLKSYYPGFFNDSITITNCSIRSSASAIKFGSASFGGFKNISINDIQVFDTFRSAIAIESVDGAHIENVWVSNIKAINTGNAIFIRLGQRSGKEPGLIKNIYLKNISVQVPFDRADSKYDLRGPEVSFFHNPFPASIVGIEGSYIQNVTLENITISYPGRATKGMAYIPLSRLHQVPEKRNDYPEFSMFGELPAWAFYVRHVDGIRFINIKCSLEQDDFRPAFVFDDVKKIEVSQLSLPEKEKPQVILKNVVGPNTFPIELKTQTVGNKN